MFLLFFYCALQYVVSWSYKVHMIILVRKVVILNSWLQNIWEFNAFCCLAYFGVVVFSKLLP
jgi:hypothetical protein